MYLVTGQEFSGEWYFGLLGPVLHEYVLVFVVNRPRFLSAVVAQYLDLVSVTPPDTDTADHDDQ